MPTSAIRFYFLGALTSFFSVGCVVEISVPGLDGGGFNFFDQGLPDSGTQEEPSPQDAEVPVAIDAGFPDAALPDAEVPDVQIVDVGHLDAGPTPVPPTCVPSMSSQNAARDARLPGWIASICQQPRRERTGNEVLLNVCARRQSIDGFGANLYPTDVGQHLAGNLGGEPENNAAIRQGLIHLEALDLEFIRFASFFSGEWMLHAVNQQGRPASAGEKAIDFTRVSPSAASSLDWQNFSLMPNQRDPSSWAQLTSVLENDVEVLQYLRDHGIKYFNKNNPNRKRDDMAGSQTYVGSMTVPLLSQRAPNGREVLSARDLKNGAEDFARYLLSYHRYQASYGYQPDELEVSNEPTINRSATDSVTFIPAGADGEVSRAEARVYADRLTEFAAAVLRVFNSDPVYGQNPLRLHGPNLHTGRMDDVGPFSDEWITSWMSNPDVACATRGISFHTWWTGGEHKADYRRIGELADRFDRPTWVTENGFCPVELDYGGCAWIPDWEWAEGLDSRDFEMALDYAHSNYLAIRYARTSRIYHWLSIFQYNMNSPEASILPASGARTPGYASLYHFSRFVEPGSVVLDPIERSANEENGVFLLAFYRTATDDLVLIAINRSNQTHRIKPLLPNGDALTVSRSETSAASRYQGNCGGSVSVPEYRDCFRTAATSIDSSGQLRLPPKSMTSAVLTR